MPHVFVSYARKDGNRAHLLNGHVLGAGIKTYLDVQQLAAGSPFRPELQQALDASFAVVAICTRASMASSEVLFEIAYAIGRRIPVIPLRWDAGCILPPFLAAYQRLDFSESEDWPSLVLQLTRLPAASAEPLPALPALDKLFLTRAQLPVFEEQLADAQSIDICGMSLLGVATRHPGPLLAKAKRGCKLRLLLLNPENENLMKLIASFVPSFTIEDHTEAIKTSLKFQLLTKDPALYKSDLVQIRLYDYPLAHGMLIINRDMPNGRLRVEMYMHTSLPADSPGFYVAQKDWPRLFNIFAAEFDADWASATPYPCANGKQAH